MTLGAHISLRYIPNSGIAEAKGMCALTMLDNTAMFPNRVHEFTFPPAVYSS